MIEVREVKTKKEQKEFLNFPLKLYKGNDCFVPPLYSDEKKIFKENYVYYDTCKAVYFNAYKDGVMVGRISGIIQNASNEKTGEKRVRFTRFDSIDNQEVANALFAALEKWAVANGMEKICGPLGFSDLEREGLLINGFEHLATFEEQYNADYYQKLIENCGYEKEVDWVESKLTLKEVPNQRLETVTAQVMKKYNLRFSNEKRIGKFIKMYGDDFFRLLDQGYENIYGTVPFTENMKKLLIGNFKLLLGTRYVSVILNDQNEAICMALVIPSIAKAVQKSGGRLTIPCLLKILKSKRKPEILDFGLIAVDKRYINKGVSICFLPALFKMLKETGTVKWMETNLNLENNIPIQNMWKHFNGGVHKRRRSFIKNCVFE